MGGIQNQVKTVLFADFQNLIQLAHPSAVAHENHGPGLAGDLFLHVCRIQAQVLVHIGENGLQVFIEDGVVGGDEGHGSGDDFVAVLPAVAALEDVHRQMEAGGVGV